MTGPVLADLTSEQRAAVTHPGGPAIVLAGAGAGKTRVLCHRLAWLVDQGASPTEILALTFTREAAVELRARAEDLIGGSHETLRVTTFHAFARELARVHGVERGLLPDVAVARTEDRMLMLLDRMDELDLRVHDLRGDRARLVADLVERIDKCRDQLVTAEQYRRWAEEAERSAGSRSSAHRARREVEIARVLETHDRWLEEEGREDFGLSIVRALELLRGHPDRLEAARSTARHVLVDEFQDTNPRHAQPRGAGPGSAPRAWASRPWSRPHQRSWVRSSTRSACGPRKCRSHPTASAPPFWHAHAPDRLRPCPGSFAGSVTAQEVPRQPPPMTPGSGAASPGRDGPARIGRSWCSRAGRPRPWPARP